MPTWNSIRLNVLVTFGVYLALAIAFTYPLITHFGSVVPSDPGDPVLNTWILWWNAKTVPFTSAWWNAPAFYPAAGVLSFSEHLAGLSWISTPVFWLSGNAQLAYNAAFFLTFPFSALAAYLLCFELTGRRDASFVGGLVFGFAPYRISHLPQIQVLASYWMPLALLGLHRFVRDGRARWLALFGISFLMQALCNGYFLVFFSVLVLLWLAWFLPWRNWRAVGSVALAWGLAALPLVPLMLKYRAIHESFGLGGRLGALDSGADIFSVLDASPFLAVWGFVRVYHQAEGELFPGIAGIGLVAAAIVVAVSRGMRARVPSSLSRARIVFAIAAVAFLAGAISAARHPWHVSILGLSVSATNPAKPFGFAIVALIGLVLTSPTLRAGYRRRSPFAFYVVAGIVIWLFCLGPLVTAWGVPVLHGGPYRWLLAIPGVDRLRVPARFVMVAIVCLSAAAALAFARIAPVGQKRRLSLVAVLGIAALADGWMGGMPVAALPERWQSQSMEAAGAVVELPYGDGYRDLAAMYRSIYHGHPVVNGYSGYFTPAHDVLQYGLERTDPQVLHDLTILGVKYAVVDMRADADGKWSRYVGDYPGVERTGSDGRYALYRFPFAAGSLPLLPAGPNLQIPSIRSDINAHQLGALTDHDLVSRWESGPQQAPHALTLDLGAPTRVGAVILSLGPYAHDFPRELVVELSDDGRTWTAGWHGEGAGPALVGAIQDPRRVPIAIGLGDVTTRFIRLRQIGSDPVYYWSVAELSVLGPPQR
jgi:hypothetical protein